MWIMFTAAFQAVTGSCGGWVPGSGWIWFCRRTLRAEACSHSSAWVLLLRLVYREVRGILTKRYCTTVFITVMFFQLTWFWAGACAICQVGTISYIFLAWNGTPCRGGLPFFMVASTRSSVPGRVGEVLRRWTTVVVLGWIRLQLVRVGAVGLFPGALACCFFLSAVLFGTSLPILPQAFSVLFWWQLRLGWVRCLGFGVRRSSSCFTVIYPQHVEIWRAYDLFSYFVKKGREL